MGKRDSSMTGRSRRRSDSEVTLRNVAVEAGVSLMTVSNVINNRFELMTPETRARVEEAIRRLSYRPNSAARSLRSARKLAVGMIIVDRSPTFLADPFTTHLVAGLSNHLNERGYVVALQGVHHHALSDSSLLDSMRTDALCVYMSGPSGRRKEILETVQKVREPVVLFQEQAPSDAPDICSIRQDDSAGGRWLGEHLLKRGARKLVFLAPSMIWPAMDEREHGARSAIEAHGDDAVLHRVSYEGDVAVAGKEALAQHTAVHGMPHAVIGGNDQAGNAAMEYVKESGLKIPDDVAVTGFNAFEFWRYLRPVLTTVRSCAYEMGDRGGREVLSRLEIGQFAVTNIMLPVEPIVGEST